MSIKKWMFRHLWIGCIIITLIAWFIIYSLPLPQVNNSPSQINDSSNLLTAISTNLAAIFALVFAVTTFLAEMIKGSYKEMDYFLRKKFIFICIFFSALIIYPLLVLKTNIDILTVIGIDNIDVPNLSITTSIAVMVLGIIVLIPYTLDIFKIVKFNAIPKLKHEAKIALAEDRETSLWKVIEDLSYLGEDFIESDYKYHMGYIIDELKHIGFKTVEKNWVDETLSTLTGLNKIGLKIVEDISDENGQEILDAAKVLKAIKEIGLKAVDKKLLNVGTADIPVAFDALSAIGTIGVDAANKKLSKVSLKSLEEILAIGIKAAEDDLGMSHDPLGLIEQTSDRLMEMGIKADKVNLNDITKKSIHSVWILSANIQKYHREPEEWAKKLCKKLNGFKLQNQTAIILFQNEFSIAKELRPDLSIENDSFKEIFDNCCNRTPE